MKRNLLRGGRRFAAPLCVILASLVSHPASAADQVTLTYGYIEDSNDKTFHDKTVWVDYRQVYVAAFLGNWQRGGEVGGYMKDDRKSVYGGYVRVREFDESCEIHTDQLLSGGYVAKALLRYIHVSDPETANEKTSLFVYGVGFDKYYGDYHYFSAVYYNDPRESGRFSVVVSNTWATEASLLRVGVVPRSDGSTGYFATVKHHRAFAGYSYFPKYDFSTFNRQFFTLGYQIPF